MACGYHHCGGYWDWHCHPYPAYRRWPLQPPVPVAAGGAEDLDALREHLRRLESEITHVRQIIEETTRNRQASE